MASHQLLHDAYFITLHTSPLYVRSGTFRQGSGAIVNYSFSRAFHLFPAKMILRERESLMSKITFSSQTAELLQVYGGQMDMIFSVHVSNGRVSTVGNSAISCS